MKAIQLKSSIHEIVDRIQSKQLLQALYDFLKTRETVKPGSLWEGLTKEQSQEVLASFEESDNPNNLVEVKILGKSTFDVRQNLERKHKPGNFIL